MTAGRMPHSQRGAVLITAIIFMLVLTMLVLAMIRSGTVEERMARNARDHQNAMQAADGALRHAETLLVSGAPFDPFDPGAFGDECAGGLCYKPKVGKLWDTVDWESTSTTSLSDTVKLSGVTKQPRYMIEILTMPVKVNSAVQCDNGVAKITARGTGNGGSVVYLQSIVRFRVFSNICN